MDLLRSNLSRVRIPEPTNRIYKQECCLSFDTPVISSLPLVFCLVPEKKKQTKRKVQSEKESLSFWLYVIVFFHFCSCFRFPKFYCTEAHVFVEMSSMIFLFSFLFVAEKMKVQSEKKAYLFAPFKFLLFYFCQTNCAFSPVQLVLKIWGSIIGTMLCVFVCLFASFFFSTIFSLSFFLSFFLLSFLDSGKLYAKKIYANYQSFVKVLCVSKK